MAGLQEGEQKAWPGSLTEERQGLAAGKGAAGGGAPCSRGFVASSHLKMFSMGEGVTPTEA